MSKSQNCWDQICAPAGAVTFDVSECTVPEHANSQSPIDDFYAYQSSILLLGTPKALLDHNALGRLLLLALVSGVEAYFRNILSRVLNCCHVCRAHSSQQMLPLAAIDYYSDARVTLGLFENTSFASEGEIVKQTRRFTKIDCPPPSELVVAIERFEAISQLRHASVHSRGILNSRNAAALQLPKGHPEGAVVIRLKQLHAIAEICLTTVRVYNRFLYGELMKRWIKEGTLKWQWRLDASRFSPLYSAFASRTDKISLSNSYRAYLAVRTDAIQGMSQKTKPIVGGFRASNTMAS